MNKETFVTKNIIPGQFFILIVSGLFILIDGFFLIVNFAFYMLIIFIIHLTLTIILNYVFSKLYVLKIQQNIIMVKNIWKEKSFDFKRFN